MRNVLKYPKSLLLAGFFVVAITAVAWQTDNKGKKNDTSGKQSAGDTTAPRQHDTDEFKLKELDEVMRNLDLQMKNINIDMKSLNVEISKEVNEVLANVDFEQIGKEVQNELKNIDFEKINKEMQDELKKVDLNKINQEVNQSLKEVQEEIKKIDIEKLQTEMKQMQLKLNNTDLKKEINDAMQNAQKEIDKAHQELKDLKDFTDLLQKDGLIDKKKGYTIEWKKDGDLIINGKIQPKEISDKYSRFYKKEGYKIKINPDDDLEIGEF